MKNPPLRIAIVGLGSAGRARQKACAEVEGIELAAIVSRRPGIGTRGLEEVLSDPAIGAVAISTENADHPASVRRALEAGKHVLCDYPLAFSSDEAKDLYRLAEHRDKILHVEHLSILSEAHRIFKTQAAALGPLQKGEFKFLGDWREALRDEERQGPFPFLAESRLVQLCDLFGDFEMIESDWEATSEKAHLFVRIKFLKGGLVDFWEKRSPGARRERIFRGRFERGDYGWPGVVEPPGLFRKDLEFFRQRILSGSPNYYDEGLMFKVIEYLEKISKGEIL